MIAGPVGFEPTTYGLKDLQLRRRTPGGWCPDPCWVCESVSL